MNHRILVIITLFLIMTFNPFKSISQISKSVNEIKGITVGERAPEFSAVDANNNTISLSGLLDSGAVVIIFYRGKWCPYCSKHLSQIQDSLQQIVDAGANVIAISPEKPEYAEKMINKTGATFTVLFDEGYKISDSFDLTFSPAKKEIFKYNTFLNADLKEAHSEDTQQLPVPATFIINREGIIIWQQFDPDYKNRSTVKDILLTLKAIP